jgi:hypothetical protein
MGPYAGIDYSLTFCPLQSRLQQIYHGQPYARVDFIPQSRSLDLASGNLVDICLNSGISKCVACKDDRNGNL